MDRASELGTEDHLPPRIAHPLAIPAPCDVDAHRHIEQVRPNPGAEVEAQILQSSLAIDADVRDTRLLSFVPVEAGIDEAGAADAEHADRQRTDQPHLLDEREPELEVRERDP